MISFVDTVIYLSNKQFPRCMEHAVHLGAGQRGHLTHPGGQRVPGGLATSQIPHPHGSVTSAGDGHGAAVQRSEERRVGKEC